MTMKCECTECGFRGMEDCEHRKLMDEIAELKRACAAYRITAEKAEMRLLGFRELAACPSMLLHRNCDRYLNISDARAAYADYESLFYGSVTPSLRHTFAEWLMDEETTETTPKSRVTGVHTPVISKEVTL